MKGHISTGMPYGLGVYLERYCLESSEGTANPEIQIHACIYRAGFVPVGFYKTVEGLQNGWRCDGGKLGPVDGLRKRSSVQFLEK